MWARTARSDKKTAFAFYFDKSAESGFLPALITTVAALIFFVLCVALVWANEGQFRQPP